MNLVLGSSSVFRASILKEAGFNFEVVEPRVNEKLFRSDQPEALVIQLGTIKALAAAERFPIPSPVVIICSDQVIGCGGEIFEKPLTEDGQPDQRVVYKHLLSYATNPAVAYTSVVVFNLKTRVMHSGYDVTEIHFERFTQTQMDLIAADEWTYRAAGSVPTRVPESNASSLLESKIKKVNGEMTGFQGLPLPLTFKLLQAAGYTLP